MSQMLLKGLVDDMICETAKSIIDKTFIEEDHDERLERIILLVHEYASFYNPDSCCHDHKFPSKEKVLAEINAASLYDKYVDIVDKAIQALVDNPEKLEPMLYKNFRKNPEGESNE